MRFTVFINVVLRGDMFSGLPGLARHR